MQRIGLIGGMSWESTQLYYRILNQTVARKLGGLHSAEVMISSVDFAPLESLQRAGDWTQIGRVLSQHAHSLTGAGCTVIGLATNTMHIVADLVTEGLDARFIHIADPTAEAIVADGYSCVGLLGTRFTLEQPFYRERLEAHGLEVLVPDIGITNLNGIIYEELCRGIINPASRAIYVDSIRRLADRGAEAVILGCTEIGLLINDDDSPLPTFETTTLHAEALAAAALD